MFGFVLPQVDELTVAQFLRFRRCYCGLCRTLGREYGHAARLILNYDFTFLAMHITRTMLTSSLAFSLSTICHTTVNST